MKICLISPFSNSSSDDILSFIEGRNSELTVLPGIHTNTPAIEKVQNVIENESHVFMESPNGFGTEKGETVPCIVTKENVMKMPKQLFWRNPRVGDIDELISIWAKRTIKIGSIQFTFVICGEINGFNRNGELRGNRDKPNHDIIVNPCHAPPMGHWNHLGPKLENLSRNAASFHVVNNTRNHHGLTTDLRAYVNGENVTEKFREEHLSWSELEIGI